jgi:hypothetical protein
MLNASGGSISEKSKWLCGRGIRVPGARCVWHKMCGVQATDGVAMVRHEMVQPLAVRLECAIGGDSFRTENGRGAAA